jgi:hypothetical protein
MSLFHLLPFHHGIQDNFLGKLNRQHKNILPPKEIIRIMADVKSGVLVGIILKM